MKNKARIFESGQGWVEYALVAVLVVVVIVTAVSVLKSENPLAYIAGQPSALTISAPEDACTKNGTPAILDVSFSSSNYSVTYIDRNSNIVVDRINDRGQVFQRLIVLGAARCEQ